jgi:hypothetical protein
MFQWYGRKVINEVFRLLADGLRRSGSLNDDAINLILDGIRRLEDQPALAKRPRLLERIRRLARLAVAHLQAARHDGQLSSEPLPGSPPPSQPEQRH